MPTWVYTCHRARTYTGAAPGQFLDSIKHKAAAVYLLGDMFDFWYKFRLVVPKCYTRFLGKLSELTDME